VHPGIRYLVSLPERSVRALSALVGGAVHESAHLLLPRFVRESRLYEATAKNALRITIELIGTVEPAPGERDAGDAPVGRLATQKAVGNVAEVGAIAAFGFSPLWLLAGAADVLDGSRVYLRTLEDELRRAGMLPEDTRFDSVDQLIGALSGGLGGAGTLIDVPPLELDGLRRAMSDLRANASSLPARSELALLFDGLMRTARLERRPLLEVSAGIGLAFLTSARRVGHERILDPYVEDLRPLRDEGFGAYAARVAAPYGRAVARQFAPGTVTTTEMLPEHARSARRWLRDRLRRGPSQPG